MRKPPAAVLSAKLGYDLPDAEAIVNSSGDRLGMNGINTPEEMAFARALVIEAVRPRDMCFKRG